MNHQETMARNHEKTFSWDFGHGGIYRGREASSDDIDPGTENYNYSGTQFSESMHNEPQYGDFNAVDIDLPPPCIWSTGTETNDSDSGFCSNECSGLNTPDDSNAYPQEPMYDLSSQRARSEPNLHQNNHFGSLITEALAPTPMSTTPRSSSTA